MTILTDLPAPSYDRGNPLTVAAAAVDAVKTYGKGDAAVHALDHVSVAFETGRFTAITARFEEALP